MNYIEKRVENFKLLKSQIEKIENCSKIISKALNNKNKILLIGNGGSASDCNHIAAEFVVKFKNKRNAMPAISLCANNSIITATANDYDYNYIFARQIEAVGNKNDVVIALSTSGKSENVIQGLKEAKNIGAVTIFLTGKNETGIPCDIEINAPSTETAHIQEMHIAILHIICEIMGI